TVVFEEQTCPTCEEKAVSNPSIRRPKRRHGRKAFWLGLFVLPAVVGGWWIWRQVQSSRLRDPLIQAVNEGNAEEVRALLEQGANPDVRVGDTTEPFSWASVL